jgi:hypothetical protein
MIESDQHATTLRPQPHMTLGTAREIGAAKSIPVLGEANMIAADWSALIEAVAAVLTITLVMSWLGPALRLPLQPGICPAVSRFATSHFWVLKLLIEPPSDPG